MAISINKVSKEVQNKIINDYKNGTYQTFIVKNIGRQDTTFSLTMNVTNISSDVIEKQKSLQSGTCVAFGRMMKIPMIVKMQIPNPAPQSSNASIFNKWMIQWKNQ